jgi:hypothetical protein
MESKIKICDICNGEYPIDKHNFEECYSLDYKWDLKQINNNINKKINGNIGESDELFCIRCLLSSDNNTLVKIFGKRARLGINVRNSAGKFISTISKSPSRYKADVIIDFIDTKETRHISIKSNNGAPYAVLNHTPRSAYVFQKSHLNKYLADLDYIVMRMNKQKYLAESGDDINIENIKFLMRRHVFALKQILMYFIFYGTGSGYSKCDANGILLVNGNNIKFIDCNTNADKMKYVETIYPKIKLSMRKKGMPCKPKHMTRKSKKNYTEKMLLCNNWIYGSNKGSLHIRVR